MKKKFKYMIYFEGKPVRFNLESKEGIIYQDHFSFEEKKFNTNKVKKYIKDYVMENGALYEIQ